MKYLLLIPLIFFAIFLESVWIHLPFTLIILIVLAIFSKEEWIFFVALLAGLFLDSVSFRLLGVSSLFFCCCLVLIFLYEKKFEIQTIPFVVGSSCIASIAYLLFFGFGDIIFQVLGSAILASTLYLFVIGWKRYLQRGHN